MKKLFGDPYCAFFLKPYFKPEVLPLLKDVYLNNQNISLEEAQILLDKFLPLIEGIRVKSINKIEIEGKKIPAMLYILKRDKYSFTLIYDSSLKRLLIMSFPAYAQAKRNNLF